MSLGELQRVRQRRAFLLTVSGFSVRYWSGAAPAAANVSGTSGGIAYTDVEAIVHVSNQRATLDMAKGLASDQGVTVSLVTRGARGTSTDPARQFLRVSQRGATRTCTLTTTLPHATGGGVTVAVDRALTAWPSSGLLHVGAEAIYYTGKAAGPDRFTGCTRAAADTRPQAHFVESPNRTPVIASEVCNWRTRDAVLQVANVRQDGTLGSWVDVVRGFVDETPALDSDGLTVSLTILPNSARLSMQLGGQAPHSSAGATHLVRGFHASDGSVATSIEMCQWLQIGTYSFEADAVTALNGGQINVPSIDATIYGSLFDGTLAAGHPRRGRVVRERTGEILETDGVGATSISFSDGNEPAATQIESGEDFRIPDIYEYRTVDLHTRGSEAIVKWPQTALAAIETAWVQGAVTGNSGLWADVRIVDGGDMGPVLTARSNATHAMVNLIFSAGPLTPFRASLSRWRKAWYPIDLRPPGASETVDPTDVFHGAPGWREVFNVSYATTSEWSTWQIVGIADAWHQRGEKFLLCEQQVVDPTSSTKHVRITYLDAGEERQITCPVTAVSTANDPDTATAIGYRYTIDESDRVRIPSFGDWPNQTRCRIEPVAAFRDESPTVIMLKLLLSGQGLGINSATYDKLPFGANLTTSDVDVNSFLRFPVPAELSRWSAIVTEGDKLADILGPMARAIGAAVVTKLDQSTLRRVIALVPATIERSLDSVATITNGDVVADRRPTSEADDEIFNRYQFEINHDPVSGAAGKPLVVFNDVVSVNEAGGETRTLKLSLRGLRIASDSPINAANTLRPLWQSLRAQFAQSRRVYRFGLPMASAVLLDPGQTITVTLDDAVAMDGSWGVTSLPVRVLEVEHGWWDEGSTVRVTTLGYNGTGWAPAMQVASVDPMTPTVAVVQANAYTDTTHPVTGAAQTDVSYFAATQAVECIPRGNFNGRASLTISTIVGNTVTFSGAHGLAAGDTIRPEDYDNAATAHKVYAYLADADRLIGTANDPAQDVT